jgi:hypothetical protein
MPSDDPNTREIPFQPSTIETIDYAMSNWLKEANIHAVTNKGFKQVPVQWVSPERSYSVKKNKDVRDAGGALILPLMTIERTGMEKDLSKKGIFWANIPEHPDHKGGTIVVSRKINQQRTAAFAAADAKYKKGQFNYPRKNTKVVYQTVFMPIPVYVDVSYKVSIRGEYQQQMNQMVQPFVTKMGGDNYFIISHDNHRFESFMQSDFAQESNVAEIGEEERYYQTTFDIKVLGYLMGASENEEKPKMVIRENAVEVKIGRERIILGDELEHALTNKNKAGIDGKYRG